MYTTISMEIDGCIDWFDFIIISFLLIVDDFSIFSLLTSLNQFSDHKGLKSSFKGELNPFDQLCISLMSLLLFFI